MDPFRILERNWGTRMAMVEIEDILEKVPRRPKSGRPSASNRYIRRSNVHAMGCSPSETRWSARQRPSSRHSLIRKGRDSRPWSAAQNYASSGGAILLCEHPQDFPPNRVRSGYSSNPSSNKKGAPAADDICRSVVRAHNTLPMHKSPLKTDAFITAPAPAKPDRARRAARGSHLPELQQEKELPAPERHKTPEAHHREETRTA